MPGGKGRSPASRSLLALLLACSGLAIVAQALPGQPRTSPSDIDFQAPPGIRSFRFLPGGPWIDFDRPLLLGAAAG
ncbi:MAG TPA: hypothetical protein VMC79_12115, partial [Rectinemataceae bacterium]|nr:hypothetical protein [Rectinemataceae bacterium]